MIASLRGRLVAGVLALAAAGMLLVGAITYATQRSFLLDRVDTQLVSATVALAHELDEDSREVARAGERIELTETEYRLLRYLMLNPRRVLTRAQLLDHVWDYDFGGDARVLETYISYLRKKLDRHGPSLIHTVRGVGYTLRAPRA
jgi:DNA-binding response OmpR family regulator